MLSFHKDDTLHATPVKTHPAAEPINVRVRLSYRASYNQCNIAKCFSDDTLESWLPREMWFLYVYIP